MPKFAANVSLMFTELPFLERFGAAAAAGFEAVEFLFPYDFKLADVRQKLDEAGLKLVLFNLPPGDWAAGMRGLGALNGREDEFEAAAHRAVETAKTLGCRQLHAMSGLEQHGADRDTYIANLKKLTALAEPHGITVLIEPINTDDIPGYFLRHTAQAADIIRAVGAANLGLQFDVYHRHKMEGEACAAIADYADLTRHYQIAAPRDRGEPDCVDLDHRAVFKAIDATEFDGWVGCEYRPRGRTEDGLSWRSELIA